MLPEIQASSWDRWKLYHLLNRTGFGVKQEEFESWTKYSPHEAVERLLHWESVPEGDVKAPDCSVKNPALVEELREIRQLPEKERQEKGRIFQRTLRKEMNALQLWWLARMRESPRPLQEKLALYWHGHFATSLQKVKNPYFMWNHLQIFRTLGHTDFRTILLAVSRDPAMLIWLDGAQSRPKAPNENYARELMELFTLGEGNYTEKDIQESARAFTGWTLDRQNQEARYVPRMHDGGAKSFMGKIGAFKDEDIIDILLGRQECSRFLARKMWRFFASQSPSEEVTGALANTLRVSGYQIKPLLRNLFLSREFYSPACMRNQIKSPVEFVLGAVRTLEVRKPRDRMLLRVCQTLGQEILQPPSVKGWDGGAAWINTSTLEMRNSFSRLLVMGGDATFFAPRLNGGGRKQEATTSPAAAATGFSPESPPQNAPEMEMDAMRERMVERLKDVPAQIFLESLLSEEAWKNRDMLVTELAERVLMSPLTGKARAQYVQALGTDDPVTTDQARQCLLSMMTDPRYQLV
ncbi:MAG: DUF1800 domain-containing protein [Verrucomicrobiae bacterium]|nr:DUF1800 domain-containing protein [Verrucomicrobiae bacterium]